MSESFSSPNPKPSGSPARRAARRVLAPVERFLAIEAASGIVLLAAAAIALLWANSPLHDSYHALWHTPWGVRIGPGGLQRDLHFFINDGLMTVFFFVVGLEIRREMHGGELSEVRRAMLPLMAALGGMLVPAAIYAAQNHDHASASGWGVPMATDIAFAVGVLALLGKRVAPALRVLLLALAIVDDIGAIVVIAVFYSAGLSLAGLALVAVGILAIVGMQKLGVCSPLLYVLPALVIWTGAYTAGVHPTLAGVIVGLMTPARASQHEAVSPVERMQHALHGWVSFAIMPLFALANAGVSLGGASLEGDGLRVLTGIALGLVLGKPLGIIGFSWIAVRTGIASLPRAVRMSHVAVIGVIGGIGFTMAIFVAQLAFQNGALLETAKLAVLCSSVLAALLGLALGRALLPAKPG